MSERRTAEIKIRLTPQEKGWWQAMADEESTTVSELIRREMNARARMRRQGQNEANPPVYVASAIGGLEANLPTVLSPEAHEVLHAGRPQRVVLEAPGHDEMPNVPIRDATHPGADRCPHGSAAWQWCGECRGV
jgi:hypothetical protein